MRVLSILMLFAGVLLAQSPVLHPLSVFKVSGGGAGMAETVAWDAETVSLFVSNARGSVTVIDVANPAVPKPRFNIALTGAVNCVALSSGLVAVAVAASPKTNPGQVVCFDKRGIRLASIPVGCLPDMLTFTPDGKTLLVANEGEAVGDVDPRGTISLIDISAGVHSARVHEVNFAHLDAAADTMRANGFRIFPGALPSVDFEPEYIAVSPDGSQAFVTLQEANALAVIDINKRQLSALHPFGLKDFSLPGQGLDPSDKDGGIHIASWPVRGMYMPDAIAMAQIGGKPYLFTANEGDARNEDTRVKKLELDAGAFADPDALKEDQRLGRLKVSGIDGDIDGDGDIDVLHSYGARSFSIWNTKGTQVFDSGDMIARAVARQTPALFNMSNDDEDADSRSDDKGSEPEAVAVGQVRERTLAFVGLERSGGVMMFDVSTPATSTLLQYVNDRTDQLGPEDIEFIPATESPSGLPLLVVANEISGTIGLYEIR